MRRIAVVTGSRAEYGTLRWLLHRLREDPRFDLQLIVTGAHLCPEFGLTVREVEKDGFEIADAIECQVSSDSRIAMAKSLGLGLISMPDALRRLNPQIMVVVGDRYEILSAVQAAALMGIPIAHISGGEVTEGAVDDWIRHCITKASWWHFAGAEPYRRRIIQMGESPERVFMVGDISLDAIRHLTPVEREPLERELGMSLRPPVFLVTFHPATLTKTPPVMSFRRLLDALEQFPDASIVMTKPNADAGGRELGTLAQEWTAQRPEQRKCFSSLGRVHYLSVMKLVSVVVGNSSSGIIEAPALGVGTVNIGPRQSGRLKATSIVDCDETTDAIVAAISKVLSPQFRAALAGTQSLYGQGDACTRITEVLAAAELPTCLAKSFYDI